MTMYEKALAYAQEKHKNQTRKYTGEPYINHCVHVVEILCQYGFNSDIMKTVAVLHDTVEDTDATFQEIGEQFGVLIRNMVFFLTDTVGHQYGNRKTRFELNAEHIISSPYPLTYAVKCADLISNTLSIRDHDPEFAKVYLAEKRYLLNAMKDSFTGGTCGIEHEAIFKRAVELAGKQ